MVVVVVLNIKRYRISWVLTAEIGVVGVVVGVVEIVVAVSNWGLDPEKCCFQRLFGC